MCVWMGVRVQARGQVGGLRTQGVHYPSRGFFLTSSTTPMQPKFVRFVFMIILMLLHIFILLLLLLLTGDSDAAEIRTCCTQLIPILLHSFILLLLRILTGDSAADGICAFQLPPRHRQRRLARRSPNLRHLPQREGGARLRNRTFLSPFLEGALTT